MEVSHDNDQWVTAFALDCYIHSELGRVSDNGIGAMKSLCLRCSRCRQSVPPTPAWTSFKSLLMQQDLKITPSNSSSNSSLSLMIFPFTNIFLQVVFVWGVVNWGRGVLILKKLVKFLNCVSFLSCSLTVDKRFHVLFLLAHHRN